MKISLSELEAFGFGENEAKIYLTLLEHGTQSPYELAESTGLNRSYLYDALNRMVEKGFVSKIKQKNRTSFKAIAPTTIQEAFAIRAAEFGRLVPELESLKRDKEDSSVELHRGADVLKTLIKDQLSLIKEGDVVRIIAADEKEFEKVEPIVLQQLFRQHAERNVKELVLIKENGHRFNQETTIYRELPSELIGNASMFIYADTVAEIVFGNPNYLILIKNKEMAEAKRKLFDHLWSNAE